MENQDIIQSFDWRSFDSADDYSLWRTAKLKAAEVQADLPSIDIQSLAGPSESERAMMIERCRLTNFAIYSAPPGDTEETTRQDLRAFAARFGLRIAEAHRSAGDLGIVALRVSSEPGKAGYIPYSSKPMNWHTDGYYNAPDNHVGGFVLHCFQQAGTGGENQILDHEIAYLRLRDENPQYVRAMMHPQAMTIPENREADGKVRPASTGPVFFPDAGTGRMQMRYTARTRSIAWRDDPATKEAAEFLRGHLAAGDSHALRIRLLPGQGVLNNNVLHNRTGFSDTTKPEGTRIIFRVRFSNRIRGS